MAADFLRRVYSHWLLVYAAVLGGLGYFFRPLFHDFAIYLYMNPAVIQTLVVTVLAAGFYVRRYRDFALEDSEDVRSVLNSAGTVLFIFLVFASATLALNNAYMKSEMASQVEAEATEISALPDVDAERPRILPKSVAREYASNSLQTPRYRLGNADIAVDDSGDLQWSLARVPDRLVNIFVLKQQGASLVDMSTSGKSISYTDDEMRFGEGMAFFDNLYWQLKKERFWVSYQDAVNIPHEGDNYIAVPMVGYDFHFRFPIVFTTPKYEGVALVDENGSIEMLGPEEAASNEVLRDQRIYPYDLARFEVSSMAYRNGILNAWFIHEDQLEIGSVPGFDNDQPFTVPTEDGLELFTATEPYGDAEGLFEIWVMDGQTGEPERYALNRSEALLGAEKATNYVRKSNSRVNWERFSPSEPLPVVVKDRLYWQVRVISSDSSGIAFTSFVDASSGDVVNIQEDGEITDFLSQGPEADINETVGTGDTGGEVGGTGESVAELVIMENGSVSERIPIYENETLELRKR
jgi:hypothetical protein